MGVTIKKKYSYSVEDIKNDLGGLPPAWEILRLVEYYPTYKLSHRRALLEDIQDGSTPLVIAQNKVKAKSIDHDLITKQGKGGHVKWAISKLRRFTIRIIYLRLRLDKEMRRRAANAEVYKSISFYDEIDSYESIKRTIRASTLSPILDQQEK
jgi:hypothetical protein